MTSANSSSLAVAAVPFNKAVPAGLNVVPFDDLAKVEPQAPHYVLEGLVPIGVVTLLSAHGGTGKSLFALMLAVSVALGRPLFGIQCKQSNVVFFSGEDGGLLMRHRLHHICKYLGVDVLELKDRLHLIDATEDPILFSDTNVNGVRGAASSPTYAKLEKFVEANHVGFVIIDNASDTFDSNEIDRARVRAYMRLLSILARKNEAGLLLLGHVPKFTNRGDQALNTEGYSGSTAWHNSARSRIFMSRDKNGGLVIEHKKNNLGNLCKPIHLSWAENGIPKLNQIVVTEEKEVIGERSIKALIRLIDEYTRRGEFVPTALQSRTNASKLMRGESTFPRNLKDSEIFQLLRDIERQGYIKRELYKGADRKSRERWQVTLAGFNFAGVSAVSAVTAASANTHCNPPSAASAASAAPRGVGVEERT